MSYCRFSTDDFGCDVYTYADLHGGFTTHLAGNRHVGMCPKVDWDGLLSKAISAEEFAAQQTEQLRWLANCERKPITIPCAGETFHDPDLVALRSRLLDLRALGFRFPDAVIAAVDREIADQTALAGA